VIGNRVLQITLQTKTSKIRFTLIVCFISIFSLNNSDNLKGRAKVVYYVLDDIAEIEGVLKTKAGNIELSGKVKVDGSADISLKMKLADGKEIKGDFSFKSDGSGTGIITADNKKYNVKFNADGTGEICDEANICESFS
jgi:hypothetical protein